MRACARASRYEFCQSRARVLGGIARACSFQVSDFDGANLLPLGFVSDFVAGAVGYCEWR